MSAAPNIHEWHSPSNESCEQNHDTSADCTCKKKRNRKPYRVIRVSDREKFQKQLDVVMEVHPNGMIVLREKGRRTTYHTTVRRIYDGILWNEAMARAKSKRKKRAK